MANRLGPAKLRAARGTAQAPGRSSRSPGLVSLSRRRCTTFHRRGTTSDVSVQLTARNRWLRRLSPRRPPKASPEIQCIELPDARQIVDGYANNQAMTFRREFAAGRQTSPERILSLTQKPSELRGCLPVLAAFARGLLNGVTRPCGGSPGVSMHRATITARKIKLGIQATIIPSKNAWIGSMTCPQFPHLLLYYCTISCNAIILEKIRQ
jgi:hypothetical protein